MIKKFIYTFFLLYIFIFQILSSLAVADPLEIDLYIQDHKFNPDVLEVPAGKKIVITLHNLDPTIEEFESLDLKREKIILGNSSVKIILAPLPNGEYKFFGEFHEKTAQGKIIVK